MGRRYPRFSRIPGTRSCRILLSSWWLQPLHLCGRTRKNTLQGIWSGICQIASGAFELLKNVILAPVLLLIDLVTGNFSQLASDAANIWNNIRNAASQIWSGIRQVVISAASGLKQGVETVLSAPVPVCLPDLVCYEADGVFCLERNQDHGSEYRLRTA